ncbi:MAG: SDR family oxidoreductase [Desulfobacterales bacterium]|nr:MAG: SDR family oxidoreductase [Desulfobacterales bacterium]
MSIINDLFDLNGRVALVTGGSSGIGRAIASTLAAAGAAVIHAALEAEENALQEAVAQVKGSGGKAAYVTCDVSKLEALPEAVEQASSFFGPPDILANAAGVNLREPWDKVSVDTWNRTIAINLTAPFFLARLLIPAMQEKGWGKIINIASLQSMRAFPNSAPYGASKGGVMQLTRAMAEAWSANMSGITCNAIAPGFFRTGLTRPLYDDQKVIQALARQTIIGRNGELADLSGLAIFLASRASDYITGQTIFLDGGWSAK